MLKAKIFSSHLVKQNSNPQAPCKGCLQRQRRLLQPCASSTSEDPESSSFSGFENILQLGQQQPTSHILNETVSTSLKSRETEQPNLEAATLDPETVYQTASYLVSSLSPLTSLQRYLQDKNKFLTEDKVAYLISKGLVSVNYMPIRYGDFRLQGADIVVVDIPEGILNIATPQNHKDVEILYEDAHLVVVNKPPDVTVHPTRGVLEGTLVNHLLDHYRLPAVDPACCEKLPETLYDVADQGGVDIMQTGLLGRGGRAAVIAGEKAAERLTSSARGIHDDVEAEYLQRVNDAATRADRAWDDELGGMYGYYSRDQSPYLQHDILPSDDVIIQDDEPTPTSAHVTDSEDDESVDITGVTIGDKLDYLSSPNGRRATLNIRPGIVHRLDRYTSGVMVVAKDRDAYRGLKEQFKKHEPKRVYLSLCIGKPAEPQGIVKTNIAPHPSVGDAMINTEYKGTQGVPAVSRYKVLKHLAGGLVSVILWKLDTGRTHQIRMHASHIGTPIMADALYGQDCPMQEELRRVGRVRFSELFSNREVMQAKRRRDGRTRKAVRRVQLKRMVYKMQGRMRRMALHAYVLEFEHPVVGGRVGFKSVLPDDMRRVVSELGQA